MDEVCRDPPRENSSSMPEQKTKNYADKSNKQNTGAEPLASVATMQQTNQPNQPTNQANQPTTFLWRSHGFCWLVELLGSREVREIRPAFTYPFPLHPTPTHQKMDRQRLLCSPQLLLCCVCFIPLTNHTLHSSQSTKDVTMNHARHSSQSSLFPYISIVTTTTNFAFC